METTPKNTVAEAGAELWALASRSCNDALRPEDLVRLESLLAEDPQARHFYGFYMLMHAELAWRFRADGQTAIEERGIAGLPAIDGEAGFGVRDSGFGIRNSEPLSAGVAVQLPQQLDPESQTPNPRTPSPEPPFPSLSTTNYPLPTSDFVGSWAFSCMVSAVILGVAILGLWAYKITHHQHIAEAPSQSAPSGARQEMVFVGRITGMVDVKWSDDPRYLPPPGYAHVPLGRKYKLDSGLMEITYDSGAKVILQGPCTYEVESTAGGYLSLGKLTARVEKRGEGRGARGEGSEPNPQSLIPNPLFAIRTPTAIVTDLGTEFGVEVDKAGVTESHVFRGKVEVRLGGGKEDGRAIRLGVGESARVGPDQDQVVRIIRSGATAGLPSSSGLPSKPEAFVRRMPQWAPIELYNTGVELKEGDEDPHWQIVARGDDPDFQPQQAVVTAAVPEYYRPNYLTRSQWISTANGPPDVPNATYTFRTTFELAEMWQGQAFLRARFIADNHVKAIRLNGKELPVPEHEDGTSEFLPFWEFVEFSAREGFVKGTNTLEIDVLNGTPSEAGGSGAMGLRVELSGFVLAGRSSVGAAVELPLQPRQPRGKEGAAMN